MRRALITLSTVLHKQLVNAMVVLTGFGNGDNYRMAENSQIPRRGYILLIGRIEQNLGGVSIVGSGPGPNRWLNRWLSLTIASI